MDDSKPREFWVIDHGGMTTSYSVQIEKPEPSFIWVKEKIHVVEFEAYEKLLKENAMLREEFRDAVMSVLGGQFMFQDPNTKEYYYDSLCMSDGEHYLPLAIKYGWIDEKQVKRI